MRKLLVVLFAIVSTLFANAQSSTGKSKIKWNDRPGDHILLQLSSEQWLGAPDSINDCRKGLSRGAGIYVMMNKPFKNNPKFSIGIGIGVGTSNVFFEKTDIAINGTTPVLQFNKLDSTNRFKKYKLSTAYLEVPLEFRFMAKPNTPNKSFKFAVGIRGGVLLSASSKGKNLQDPGGNTINEYTSKIKSKSYFNNTRIAGTARIGYGLISLFGAYNFTPIFKDGVAADINLLQVGLTISGL